VQLASSSMKKIVLTINLRQSCAIIMSIKDIANLKIAAPMLTAKRSWIKEMEKVMVRDNLISIVKILVDSMINIVLYQYKSFFLTSLDLVFLIATLASWGGIGVCFLYSIEN